MFFIKFFSILLLSFLCTLFLPWYFPFIICFAIGLILSNLKGNNFIAGSLGVGLFWLIYILYLDFGNQHLLSQKIAHLFSDSLGTSISSTLLIIITTILGALLGGLSCMAGAMIMDDGSRKRMRKANKNRPYKMKLK